MGGVDKGLIELDGRVLVQWVVEALRPQVASLLISANRHRERYAQLGWPVLADHPVGVDVAAFQGPLAGIASALAEIRAWSPPPHQARARAQLQADAHARAGASSGSGSGPASAPTWLLVSPCDTPLIPCDLGSRLAAALRDSPARIAIAADQERTQPLHALLPIALGADLAEYLRGGGRSVLGWLARHPLATVTFEQRPSPFMNLNRPEDARALQAHHWLFSR
jgi:molybdopterin-guanine dinucleotide biosynthesis protein A